jgi:RNA polymerase sigma-70 factor (ECF subfamily)
VNADPGAAPAPARGPGDIEQLAREISPRLLRVAFRILGNREDAEDAVQNAWAKGMRHVSGLTAWDKQCAFMVCVVVNEAKQLIRKWNRKPKVLGVEGEESAHIYDDVVQHLDAKEKLWLVWRAIDRLPDVRRDVTALYMAGCEYGEIARMLGIHVSTVRSHISNARKDLRQALPGIWEGKPE